MKANEHQEINFLLKAFSRYATILEATVLFREQYGKNPTPWQIGVTNLGRFLEDRRDYFNPKENHRVRKFRIERQKYEDSKANNPMLSEAWRQEQYLYIYNKVKKKSEETGNFSRQIDILTLAAKDAAGFYNPKTQNINVDNRTVNYHAQSDDDINKTFRKLLGRFGVSVPDIPTIEKGLPVIEQEPEAEE